MFISRQLRVRIAHKSTTISTKKEAKQIMNLTKFITDDTLHCEQVVINMETWICGEGD